MDSNTRQRDPRTTRAGTWEQLYEVGRTGALYAIAGVVVLAVIALLILWLP
jgi:hypothetical protein